MKEGERRYRETGGEEEGREGGGLRKGGRREGREELLLLLHFIQDINNHYWYCSSDSVSGWCLALVYCIICT